MGQAIACLQLMQTPCLHLGMVSLVTGTPNLEAIRGRQLLQPLLWQLLTLLPALHTKSNRKRRGMLIAFTATFLMLVHRLFVEQWLAE